MTAVSTKPCLSAVFVDYDNIYLSLKRKNDEAARRFAKDAGGKFPGNRSWEGWLPGGAQRVDFLDTLLQCLVFGFDRQSESRVRLGIFMAAIN